MLVAESKDWDMTSGTWGVDVGNYNRDMNGTWKDGTHWNAVNVNANWTNFTVTFTAPAKPAAATPLHGQVKAALEADTFVVTVPTSTDAGNADAAALTAIKAKIAADLGDEAAALISAVTTHNPGSLASTAANSTAIKNNLLLRSMVRPQMLL